MSSENTNSIGGDEVAVTFAPTDKPFTIHATLGAYAKTPDHMSLKELSIRLAYSTLDEAISGAESDLRDAIFEAVRGCQSAGVTVPGDLEAAADAAEGEEWAPVEPAPQRNKLRSPLEIFDWFAFRDRELLGDEWIPGGNSLAAEIDRPMVESKRCPHCNGALIYQPYQRSGGLAGRSFAVCVSCDRASEF